MNRNIFVYLGVLGFLGMVAASFSPAQSPSGGKGEVALAQAASTNKTIYLVFYREWDAQSAGMAQAVKAHAERYSNRATWNVVQVSDANEKGIVDRFQLNRAPMPMAVTVHPNGAVTGFFASKVTDVDLVRTLVSPKKAECMKLLQENQLVLFCIKTPDQPYPQAVFQFQSDPMFTKRTTVISAHPGDPNESGFLSELKFAPGQGTTTIFLAPPGVLVGRFNPSATKSDLATALHEAGKCCDDKNCKHKH